MASRILEVILNAKDNASAVLRDAESNVQSSAGRMVTAFKVVAAAASALAIGKFLKDAVEEGMRAEETMSRMAQAVTKAGGNYEAFKPVIASTIKELARLSTFTDDDLMDAFSSMVLRTNDISGSLKHMQLVADIAASGQMDLASAAEFVAKAMNGQTKGLKAFGLEGIAASDALDILTQRFAGQALEKTKTFGGQVNQLSKAWNEFKESVGLAIIQGDGAASSMGGLTSVLVSLGNFVAQNEAAIGSFVTVIVSLGSAIWQLVKYPLGGLIMGLGVLTGATGKAVEALGFLVEQGAKILSAIGIEWPEQLGKSLRDAGKAMSDASANGIKAMVGIEQKGQDDRTALTQAGAEQRTKAEQDAQDEIERVTKQGAERLGQLDRGATERQTKEALRRKQLLLGANEDQKEQLLALWDEQDKAQKERDKKAEEARKETAKKLTALQEEIWVKTQMYERRITEQQAKELLEREKNLGRSLNVTVTSVVDAQRQLDVANERVAQRWTAHLDQVDKGLGALTPKVVDSTTKWRSAYKSVEDQLDAVAKVGKQATDRLASLADAQEEARRKATEFREALTDASRGAIGLAQGVGAIGDTAAAALQNVTSLGDGLGKLLTGGLSSGGVVGAITGVVGAVAGLAKSLFGESPEEAARKDLIRKNTDALRGLTQATGDLLKVQASGNQITKIRDFLGGLFGPQGQYSKGAYTAGKMKSGITDAEVEALAGELGITLRNSKSGAIESKALYQLFQALQGLDSGFSNTFKGQIDRINTGISLGAISKDRQFAEIVGAISGLGGNNAILSALQGADFGTMEGRTAAADQLRGLFTAFSNNQIKADQLGGLSGSDFVQALGDLIGILTDPERLITGVAMATPDTPALDLSTAFGDLSVTFEDIGQQQVDYLASINTGIGGLLERWTDIDTGRVVQAAPVTISVGEVVVTTAATDAAGTGEAVQAAVTAAINQALADAYLDRQLATGNVTRTVS